MYESLWSSAEPSAVYDEFIRLVLEILLEQGASRREGTTRRRRAQPLWWSEECDAKIRERRGFYKAYYKEQTAERKVEFKRKDSEVKLFLRRQKRNSFRAFCESLDPSQGINRIWRTVRALASKPGALRTNVVTDADLAELRVLRDDLVRADVPPVDIPLEEVGIVDDPLDEPFSRNEFDSALGACRTRSAPGLDGISYDILRKFSDGMYSFKLCLFNCMFRDSSFPPSWRDTYVILLPKPGGKGHRPISLTYSISRLFERMVHRRLKHRAEHGNWVPNFQFGFRKSRSALDAVAVVSTNISQAFGRGESVAAVSVDIKGAFNSVLPVVLSGQLRRLGLPSRILNFISYMTSRRVLSFSGDGSGARSCGLGVPQGGALSPILYNIYTS